MSFFTDLCADATARASFPTIVKMAEKKASNVLRMNPMLVHILPGLNPRDMTTHRFKAHVEWLAGQIKQVGFLDQHALSVFFREGKCYVASGHARLLAVQAAIKSGAAIATVPVVAIPSDWTDQDVKASAVSSDNNALEMTVLELAQTVKELLKHGWTEKRIAARMGVSEPRIYQLKDVLALPGEVHAKIAEGVISASLAVDMCKGKGATEAVKIVTEVVIVAKADAAKKNGKAAAKAKAKGKPAPAPVAAKVRRDHVKAAKLPLPAATPAKTLNGAEKRTLAKMDECTKIEIEALKSKIKAAFAKGRMKEGSDTRTITFTIGDFTLLRNLIGL